MKEGTISKTTTFSRYLVQGMKWKRNDSHDQKVMNFITRGEVTNWESPLPPDNNVYGLMRIEPNNEKENQ